MALSCCTENASEILGRRRTDFIRMLPKRNYGEAALTILGVKPVSIISGAEPVLKFLLERPAELHGLGVSLHRGRRDLGIDYLLVNRWAVAAIESPLFSNFKSREHAIYEVFNSQEMMDNHGGLFLGYAQCYRPRALSYVFRWSAFSKSEDERNSSARGFVTRYIGFGWDTDDFIGAFAGDYSTHLTRLCMLIERVRQSGNAVKVEALSFDPQANSVGDLCYSREYQ